MNKWAQELLPDQPSWIHELIEDEFKKREDEIARLRAERDALQKRVLMAEAAAEMLDRMDDAGQAEIARLRAELARLKAAARPVIQWRSGCRGTTYAISKLRAAVEGDRDE